MEPRLIPVAAESITSEVDYTQGLIARQYLQDGAKYYFTLHREHYVDVDGQVPTGRYLAVILSPKGLRSFYLIPDDIGNYIIDQDEEEETPPQHTMVNEHGQLEPVINIADYQIPFTEEMRQHLEEINNMDAYLQMINEVIHEKRNSSK